MLRGDSEFAVHSCPAKPWGWFGRRRRSRGRSWAIGAAEKSRILPPRLGRESPFPVPAAVAGAELSRRRTLLRCCSGHCCWPSRPRLPQSRLHSRKSRCWKKDKFVKAAVDHSSQHSWSWAKIFLRVGQPSENSNYLLFLLRQRKVIFFPIMIIKLFFGIIMCQTIT